MVNPGLFFLVYAVVLTVTRPLAGAFFDRRGPEGVMGAGFLRGRAVRPERPAVIPGWPQVAGPGIVCMEEN